VQQYIRHLIFEVLSDGSIVEVLRKLMKLPWAEAEPYLLKCLLKVQCHTRLWVAMFVYHFCSMYALEWTHVVLAKVEPCLLKCLVKFQCDTAVGCDVDCTLLCVRACAACMEWICVVLAEAEHHMIKCLLKVRFYKSAFCVCWYSLDGACAA
jgi:hypothetical protein